MTLSSKWKVKIFTTSLIKSWSYQFLSLIDLKSIKKFIIASAKIFLALNARKAAKWPRTFYVVLTVGVRLIYTGWSTSENEVFCGSALSKQVNTPCFCMV